MAGTVQQIVGPDYKAYKALKDFHWNEWACNYVMGYKKSTC